MLRVVQVFRISLLSVVQLLTVEGCAGFDC